MIFFFLIEVGVSQSGSRMPKIDRYSFAYTAIIFLSNVFYIWKDDNLHGLLPLD
jgi:hypothetical protein